MTKESNEELQEALLEGFEDDPTPIAANDFGQLLRNQGDRFTNRQIHDALEALHAAGKLGRAMMYDKVSKTEIWHYFAKDWDGLK